MRSRRKRYYHKTIVVRNIFDSTMVFAAAIVCGVVLLVSLIWRFWTPPSRNTIMQCYAWVLGEDKPHLYAPAASDRIAELFPVMKAAAEYQKALWAENGGVAKPDASQTGENASAMPQTSIKSIDMSAGGISFRNETGYTPVVDESLSRKLSFSVTSGAPKVLIMHTHTSEAYAESNGARTTDNEKNVVRVGSVLAKTLEEQGISVIHDKTQNDSPSYNGSYSKALSGISAQLDKHPTIEVVLDIHRDYAEQTKDGETIQLKPVTEINGEQVAQVMFVVGTDGLGLEHPDWKENLAFAVQVQAVLNNLSPKLARPINLRRERFNQHKTKGSLIVEVGTAGNSLAECERAAIYIGKAVASVLTKYQA